MPDTLLMKGNEAIGEAAIRAGCRFFYGYPITPVTELLEYMARKLPTVGGVCLQTESEVAAINMVYGTAATGNRVMTASSSPGISLKQEGISYLAAAELPAVIVNMSRCGPGLGNIFPAQSDYFQATKPGHGDYHMIVLAPASVQESVNLTGLAFYLADKYRTPTMLLGDGVLCQLMEKVTFPDIDFGPLASKDWAVDGARGRSPNVITSLHIPIKELASHNLKLQGKYQDAARNHTLCDLYQVEDADIALVAFGSAARVCYKVVNSLREEGKKVGLVRPITLFPFPTVAIGQVADRVKAFTVVEMNLGQMVEDVKLAVLGKRPVDFFGVTGGAVPTPQQVAQATLECFNKYC